MKIIIDTKIAETIAIRIIAPIVIMWLSIALGHLFATNKVVNKVCSRIKRMSSKDSIHTLLSEIPINIIVSSILFVLLYNLLAFIK